MSDSQAEGVKNIKVYNFDKKGSSLDVTFNVGQSQINASTNVLAGVSSVFCVMFSSGFTEAKTRVVDVEDIDEDSFRHFAHYCYTSEIDPTADVGKLLMLADKYEVEKLASSCDTSIKKSLTVDNVLDRLYIALLCRRENLIQTIFTFLIANGDSVLEGGSWNNQKLSAYLGLLARHDVSVRSPKWDDGSKLSRIAQWDFETELTVGRFSSNFRRDATLLVPYDCGVLLIDVELIGTAKHGAVELTAVTNKEIMSPTVLSIKFAVNLKENGRSTEFVVRVVSTSRKWEIASFSSSASNSHKYLLYKWFTSPGCIEITAYQDSDTNDKGLGFPKNLCILSETSGTTEDENVPVHKVPLRSYFSSLLKDKVHRFALEGIPSQALVIFKRFIYFYEWPADDLVDLDLLASAHRLELLGMFNYCQCILRTKLNRKNVLRSLIISYQVNAEVLKASSMTYALDNLKVVYDENAASQLKKYPQIVGDLFKGRMGRMTEKS